MKLEAVMRGRSGLLGFDGGLERRRELLETQLYQVGLNKVGCALLGLDLLLRVAKGCSSCRRTSILHLKRRENFVGGCSVEDRLGWAVETTGAFRPHEARASWKERT